MTFEEKDEDNPRPLYITHQMWCEFWLDEWCDCGYDEANEEYDRNYILTYTSNSR